MRLRWSPAYFGCLSFADDQGIMTDVQRIDRWQTWLRNGIPEV